MAQAPMARIDLVNPWQPEARLAEFDDDIAGRVHPWIEADPITLAVWKAAHSDACRQRIATEGLVRVACAASTSPRSSSA